MKKGTKALLWYCGVMILMLFLMPPLGFILLGGLVMYSLLKVV